MCIVYKEELLFEAGWIWIRQNPKVRVLIGREDFVPARDKTKKKIFSFSQVVGKPTFITAGSLWLSVCSLKLKANSFKLPSYSVILSCSGSYWTVLSAVDRRVRYIMPVYFWTYCYDQSMEHNSSIMTNSLQKNSVAWVLPTASLFFLLVLQKFESIKCCALNPGNPEFYLLVIGMEGGGGFKGSQILLLWII